MRIAIHAFDDITAFHLSTPLLVFGEVARAGLADWSTVVWSDDGANVRTTEGLLVAGLADAQAAMDADLLIWPSWPDALPPVPEALITLMRDAHARGARIAGLCLGAFPVAASGLLDGRAAVTHWARADELARRHPAVDVRPAALSIDHGDVLTSAGTASALDACLHIVREQLGAAAAATVARALVVAPHRDGDQAQYVERPLPEQAGQGAITEALEWAIGNLDQPIAVASLAAQAHMSPRSFTRRFRETTGTSPASWVLARRLDEARRLLETTELSVTQVAEACGFGSPVTLRQRFVRAYSTTPTSYRRRFSVGGVTAGAPVR
nr:helix-turn-helix domain-containing protein [Agrococcus sp. ARC_14]